MSIEKFNQIRNKQNSDDIKRIIGKKKDEISLLERLIYFLDDRQGKERNKFLTKFASLNERNFLEAKALSINFDRNIDNFHYNPEELGTCESFNATIEKLDGVWKLHLPPLMSTNIKNRASYAGNYIGYLTRNLINNFDYSEKQQVINPAICFVHHINSNIPTRQLFDADNIDSKKVIDAFTSTHLIKDDNLLELLTLYFGKSSEEEYCDVYLMNRNRLTDWLSIVL